MTFFSYTILSWFTGQVFRPTNCLTRKKTSKEEKGNWHWVTKRGRILVRGGNLTSASLESSLTLYFIAHENTSWCLLELLESEIGSTTMGSVCCCLHADDFENYMNPENSVNRNCMCLGCFVQNFLHVVCFLSFSCYSWNLSLSFTAIAIRLEALYIF